jgi:hypothetical protein
MERDIKASKKQPVVCIRLIDLPPIPQDHAAIRRRRSISDASGVGKKLKGEKLRKIV